MRPIRKRISNIFARPTVLTRKSSFASERYAQIAIQGPKALATLQKLTDTNFRDIKYYWFADGNVAGTPARIAHTGYTGEDGFEIYVAPREAARIWREVLRGGRRIRDQAVRLGRAQYAAPGSQDGAVRARAYRFHQSI